MLLPHLQQNVLGNLLPGGSLIPRRTEPGVLLLEIHPLGQMFKLLVAEYMNACCCRLFVILLRTFCIRR